MIDAPAISVVVSTFQRASRLPRLIDALERQDIDQRFEVVIVDNGSSDETWLTLERLSAGSALDLRPVRLAVNRGPSGGRNAGWRAARGSVIAFTDDDCRPTPEWLGRLSGPLCTVDIAQGTTLPDPEHESRWGAFSRSVEITGEDGFYETCNIAYRREWLERLGGFDESFRLTGEDTDLAWRARKAGARTTFVDDAVVYHEVSASDWRSHVRDKFRWGDVPLTVKRHPHLRTEIYAGRWFWRPSHRKALAALGGLVVAGWPAGSVPRRAARIAAGAALVRPYVILRTRTAPPGRCGPRRRVALLPFLLASDLLEVGVLLRSSWRHRTLII